MTPTTALERHGLTEHQWATVQANTGLINHVLDKMRTTRTDDWDDAYQDGLFGLMRAAQLYDPDRGFAFSTYAVTWIRQAIRRGRETAMGIGYRQHARGDLPGPYIEPMSIDGPATTGNGGGTALAPVTLLDLIPSDTPDPADAIGDPAAHTRARQVLTEACRDHYDRHAARHITHGTSLRDLAAEAHVSHEHIRRRIVRLRGILRHPLAGLNPDPWQDDAACLGAPVTDHYPGKIGHGVTPQVRHRCFTCPVATQCAAAITDHRATGYRAGVGAKDRKNGTRAGRAAGQRAQQDRAVAA